MRVVEPDETPVAGAESASWRRRVNPWFFALWAIGVPVLIALGLATLTSTVVIMAARWRR